MTPLNLPCKDCICLATCLGDTNPIHSGTALMGHVQNVLITKCSLLNDYLYFNPGSPHSSGVLMNNVITFFRETWNG